MVYVDNARHPFGRMLLSHMVADTTEELLEMATKIGVKHEHLQKAGTHEEHFDVCVSKRRKAIQNGAKAVTSRDLVRRMLVKRADV